MRTPAKRRSPQAQAALLTVANQPQFAHLSPPQIVPALAAQGRDLAAESTFYRVRRDADRLARRGRPQAPARVRPPPLAATGPNQLWSWDSTDLATTVRAAFFYLDLIRAVFSRTSVGWEASTRRSPPSTPRASCTRPLCARACAPTPGSCILG